MTSFRYPCLSMLVSTILCSYTCYLNLHCQNVEADTWLCAATWDNYYALHRRHNRVSAQPSRQIKGSVFASEDPLFLMPRPRDMDIVFFHVNSKMMHTSYHSLIFMLRLNIRWNSAGMPTAELSFACKLTQRCQSNIMESTP